MTYICSIQKQIDMKITTKIIARELKKELKSFGVIVLRCKQYQDNALVTIKKSDSNEKLFLKFCNENNYNDLLPGDLKRGVSYGSDYIDFGNLYKFKDA